MEKVVKNNLGLRKGVSGMKSDVTNRQIFFLLFLTLTTYTIINIPKIMAQHAGTGAWLPILLTTVIFSLLALLIVCLGNMFPGKMLFDYSREIVGNLLAYIFSIYFAAYFLLVAVYLNIQLTSVLKSEFFPRTPQWTTLIAGIIVFGCIAYKGINSTTRLFEIIGPVFLLTAVAIHAIMLTQGDFHSIFPLFRSSQLPKYIAATKETIISFLGIEVLTIIPFTKQNGSKAAFEALLSLLAIGLFYVFVVETCIMMLGLYNIQNYNYALIEAIKLVDNPVLERFDILYLTVGFAGLIAGICAVYVALVEYTCKLFPKMNRKISVFLLGAIITALSMVGLGTKNSEQFFNSVIPVSGLVSAFFIPVLLLVIAKVRGLGQKNL